MILNLRPGANANAVKELVLAGILLASRDIVGGNGMEEGIVLLLFWGGGCVFLFISSFCFF